ncbi:hypothetical protein DFH94DRAFT_392349 [Russula ochroleuca]|uniref:Uncharacterized protein n=1 Tax=Russula ochroleuca TaxID=152965 RepID=A0A9P5JVS7_9AGAM|nr:hypothetical protein DFH94DRAFT_425761 [Russula ochroleuca]KAF8464794.1 hypothetical protein DFH94DRAFT_392349 [Russula ochroleuca]
MAVCGTVRRKLGGSVDVAQVHLFSSLWILRFRRILHPFSISRLPACHGPHVRFERDVLSSAAGTVLFSVLLLHSGEYFYRPPLRQPVVNHATHRVWKGNHTWAVSSHGSRHIIIWRIEGGSRRTGCHENDKIAIRDDVQAGGCGIRVLARGLTMIGLAVPIGARVTHLRGS